MSDMFAGREVRTLVQADPNMVQSIRDYKASVYDACCSALNQKVRVETADGQIIEGTIVQISDTHVYLAPEASADDRYPFGGYGGFGGYPGYGFGGYGGYGGYGYNPIIPLALYDLLAISLFV